MEEELNNEEVQPTTENRDENIDDSDESSEDSESIEELKSEVSRWQKEAARWRGTAKRYKSDNKKQSGEDQNINNPDQFSPSAFLKIMELKEKGVQNKFIQKIFERGPESLNDDYFMEGILAKNEKELAKKSINIKGTSPGGEIHDKELQSKIDKMSSSEYKEYLEKIGKA